MGITFEDIKNANSAIIPMQIKRFDKKKGVEVSKDYAEVNQRIKAFRMVYPTGSITTELVSNVDGICIFRANVGYWGDDGFVELATGTAFEDQKSSQINGTSYIENCETSAVGRALGLAGFGIDTSVASYEEVKQAMAQQAEKEAKQKKAEPKKAKPVEETPEQRMMRAYPPREEMLDYLERNITEENMAVALNTYKATSLKQLTDTQLIVVYNAQKKKEAS